MSKRIGILGGFGAAAGVHFADTLVKIAQAEGAQRDEDFPDFLLYNCPMTGMDESGIVNCLEVKSQIQAALVKMASWGCDLAVIACNSAYRYYDELREAFPGRLVNMVDAACYRCRGKHYVGVLCSESSEVFGLYGLGLARVGVGPIYPEGVKDRQLLNNAIGAVMSGRVNGENFYAVGNIMASMQTRGADAILVGCTELPLVVRDEWVTVPIIDAAEAALCEALAA